MLLCLVQSLWKMMKYLRYDILGLFHLMFTGLSEWVAFGRCNCISQEHVLLYYLYCRYSKTKSLVPVHRLSALLSKFDKQMTDNLRIPMLFVLGT